MMEVKKSIKLAIAFAAIMVLIILLGSAKDSSRIYNADESVDINETSEKSGKFELAKEIVSPSSFLNTDPITLGELVGDKVVMIDFWTYSCINCQRTLPYLNAWYEKYRDQGLEIVSIHTPEFEFEKEISNVQDAIDKYSIEYPVVLDNDYGTWSNYKNRYWPRKYLIDIDGYIVYDHIGEGGYDETEKKIQELLRERSEKLGMKDDISGDIVNPDNKESRIIGVTSPETYFGASRNETLGNGTPLTVGTDFYSIPAQGETNRPYLEGEWTITREYATNITAGARIIFSYNASKVFMVARSDKPVNIIVSIDGNPVGEISGSDLLDSQIIVESSQLYRLVEDDIVGEHVLELIIEDPGFEIFTFTFG